MASLLLCFGCIRTKQRQRSAEQFLSALREGNEQGAAATLQRQPSLLRGLDHLGNKRNALHLAAEEGQLVVLSAVVEAALCSESVGASTGDDIQDLLNGQDASGRTPLFIACALGHADCARFLISNGADQSISDNHGNVPLHMACLRGHVGIIFTLLSELSIAGGPQNPSSVHVTNVAGLTPLHMAVWGRHSGAVQVLLQHGAELNVRTTQDLPEQPSRAWPACVAGSTPLHMAAARGHVEICKIFLKTYYERVLEPEMQRRSRNLPPLVPDLSAIDPRLQMNGMGRMPYQVARHVGLIPLSMLLRPSVSLALLFNEEERNAGRVHGPPSLKILATEALNKRLAGVLQGLVDLPPSALPQLTPPKPQPSSRRRQRPAALEVPPPPQAMLAVPGSGVQAAPAATVPRSPALLSPRTPTLQAGRRDVPSRAVSQEVEEADLLLPGMVGAPGAEARAPTPRLAQAPGSLANSGRQRSSAPHLMSAGAALPPPVLEVSSVDESSQASGVTAPRTPGAEGPARDGFDASPEGAASTVPGSELQRLDGERTGSRQSAIVSSSTDEGPLSTGSRRRTGQASPRLVTASSSQALRDDTGTTQRRASDLGSNVADDQQPEGRGSSGANDVLADDADRSTVRGHSGSETPHESLSVEPSRVGSITASVAVQDAAARLLESSRLQGEETALPTKPGGQSLSVSASTRVAAVDGFEACSMDNECGVCLENAPDVATKPCNHLMCGACALKVCTSQMQKASLCPFCRALITGFSRAPQQPC